MDGGREQVRCDRVTDNGLELESVIIDMAATDFDELRNLPPSVLNEALRRVREGSSADSEPYAGFESAI